MNLYHRLPIRLQNLALSFHGIYWRFLTRGPGFKRTVREYQSRNRWTSEQWDTWTRTQLRFILQLACDRVPYYRRTWSPSVKKSARAGMIQDIPLLDRQPIQEDPRAFVVHKERSGPKKLRFLHPPYTRAFFTSGSTGTPIVTLWTRSEIIRAFALREARILEPAGVSFSMRRAVMNGRPIFQPEKAGDPPVRYDFSGRRLHLSPFHLHPDNVSDYVRALQRYRPEWILGYAVSLGILARMIREQRLMVPPVRAIITISEPLLPWAREALEDVFRCRVYEEYGLVENVCYASECRMGRLHVSPDAGYVEILRPDGTPCDPGEWGEIVATGFLRTFQPFIRYRTGDRAVFDDRPCPCGFQTPVFKAVEGRLENILIGPDGREFSRIHLVFVHGIPVREAQVIQEGPDRIRVRLVPLNSFSEKSETEIKRRIQTLLGERVSVVIERVDEIERTPAGKFVATKRLIDS